MFIEPLFLIALVLGLVDLFLFIQISSSWGIYFIVISQIITFCIGLFMLKKLDFTLFFFIDAEIKKGQRIIDELWDEAWILVGACLLIMPGLMSDIVGGLCLVKSVRRVLTRYFSDFD